MSNVNFDATNAQLQRLPGYQLALSGKDFGFGFPKGADGLVLPGFRVENARAYARSQGVEISGGQIDQRTGTVNDPNADHWYSDPRVLGPIAVGAATGGALAFGGPAAAAASGAGTVPAAASGVTSAGTPMADFLAGAPGMASTESGLVNGAAVPSFANSIKSILTNPRDLASLAAIIPSLKLAGGSGPNPFSANSDLMGQINSGLAMQNERTKQAQPIYDALINQAYGRTPTRYRGAAPSGYPASGDAAPAGAYPFTAPQFGGR